MKKSEVGFVFLLITGSSLPLIIVGLNKQECVKERCHDIVHPPVHTIPMHSDIQPFYNVFSHKMEFHSVIVPERKEYWDPQWVETKCECVVWGVSLWDRWRQR